MQLFGRLQAAGQLLRVAEVGEPRVEKLANLPRISNAPANQQLGNDGGDASGALEGRDPLRIVRMDTPSWSHGKADRDYFFFST